MSLLFSKIDADILSNYEYKCELEGVFDKLFYKLSDKAQNYVPKTIQPNVISVLGFLLVLFTYNTSLNVSNDNLLSSCVIFSLCIIGYYFTDCLDGTHARKTNSSSPVGEIIDHSLDFFGAIFIIVSFVNILTGNNNSRLQLMFTYCRISTILFYDCHWDAYCKGFVYLGKMRDTSVTIFTFSAILMSYGLNYVDANTIINILEFIKYPIYCLANMLILHGIYVNTASFDSKCVFTLYQLLSVFNDVLIFNTNMNNNINVLLITSMHYFIISELFIQKMLKRHLQGWLILVPIVNILVPTIGWIAWIYLMVLIYDMATLLNIPVFTQPITVYCNGVFDLCHNGHLIFIKKAASYGNRLIVGVHSDKTVESYKRVPVLNEILRYNTIKNCKFVTDIVEDAPLTITEEFINKYKIDYVIVPEEYAKSSDPNYIVARKLNKEIVVDRYADISTSDIINSIKQRVLT